MGKDLKGKELGVGISQRKDGNYQARYYDRWGKRVSIYNRDLKELRKEYSIKIAENEMLLNVKRDFTLDEWFERWMEVYKEKSVRANTRREYTHVYTKHVSPTLGARKINSLVKSDIQILIDRLHDAGYGYEFQNKTRIVLRDMMQRAVEDQLVINNPVSGIKIRCKKVIRAEALTIEDQKTFFEYCKNTFYENLFYVAINTGLRPGELFALEIADIDFENGLINVDKTLVYQKYLTDEKKEFHVEPPKTATSKRNVPINQTCRHYLMKQMELKRVIANKDAKQQNNYLFVTKYNTPLNSVLYSGAITNVVEQINLFRPRGEHFEKFKGHVFRHTFATRCFENGIDAKVVQAWLGHASIKMTLDLYTHVTEDLSSEEIEKIVLSNENMPEMLG